MKKKLKPAGVFWTKSHSASPSTLQKLQNEIFSDQRLEKARQLVRILDSRSRLQIIFLLNKKDSLCVGDIADTLRLSISAVSHQLAVLRREDLVKASRRKKVVYYSLGKGKFGLINSLINV